MRTVRLFDIRAIASSVGLPTDKTSLIRRLYQFGSTRIEGRTTRGQQGFLYELDTLPERARSGLRDRLVDVPEMAQQPHSDISTPTPVVEYLKAPPELRATAEKYMRAMVRLRATLEAGEAKGAALAAVASEFDVSASSIWRSWTKVFGHQEPEWLVRLLAQLQAARRRPHSP